MFSLAHPLGLNDYGPGQICKPQPKNHMLDYMVVFRWQGPQSLAQDGTSSMFYGRCATLQARPVKTVKARVRTKGYARGSIRVRPSVSPSGDTGGPYVCMVFGTWY